MSENEPRAAFYHRRATSGTDPQAEAAQRAEARRAASEHGLTLTRRSMPERLRYLAGKLLDEGGGIPVSVALALQSAAADLDAMQMRLRAEFALLLTEDPETKLTLAAVLEKFDQAVLTVRKGD